MNKKLLVLMVVPILVAMGGTFAFSAFSGSSSIAINGTAGHLDWQNNVHLVGANANNTVITVQGPNGIVTTIGQGAEIHSSNGSYYLSLGTARYSTATSGGEYVINVTNFAPGEYVILKAVITNTGTVGMIVTDPPSPIVPPPQLGMNTPPTKTTMPSSGVSMYSYNNTTSSDKQYNPTNQPITATGVSESDFMSALQMDTGYVYNVTEGSGFGTSLSPGGTATMYIYLGLGNSNGQDVNYYQGSDISINIDLNVVSDP